MKEHARILYLFLQTKILNLKIISFREQQIPFSSFAYIVLCYMLIFENYVTFALTSLFEYLHKQTQRREDKKNI